MAEGMPEDVDHDARPELPPRTTRTVSPRKLRAAGGHGQPQRARGGFRTRGRECAGDHCRPAAELHTDARRPAAAAARDLEQDRDPSAAARTLALLQYL